MEQSEGTRVAFITVASTVGASAQVSLEVGAEDTAVAMRSGEVDVLSTPRVVALCEQATVEAMRPLVGESQTSVGFRVEITHLVPVLVGRTVVASAVLERVEGKRLIFNVTVNDQCGLVAAGRVTRVLVETSGFMEKAR